MRTVEKLTDLKYLNLYKIQDPENNVNGFYYAERLGKDSIAFICYDEDSETFLLNQEVKPPIGSMVLGAFGGSIDSNKTPLQIVSGELKEEAGFEVGFDQIKYVGRVLVSTQMNQYCYLYLVFVDKNKQGIRCPENEIEKMALISWHSLEELAQLEDWKPIVIIEKAKEKKII